MQVFADIVVEAAARRELAGLRQALQRTFRMAPGLERHGRLVAALIAAGELAQGLADAPACTAAADAALALAESLAGACAQSWDSDFADCGPPRQARALDACAALVPPELAVQLRRPEGYAFYALYPEAYLEAARLQAPRGGASSSWQVWGLRSIGTSLAPMVASGLGAGGTRTLRPVGHPFARRVAAPHAWVDRAAACHAVVDEGPGLSGSSMAAVAAWLGEAGVAQARVHFFASHGHGPGPQADEAVRATWRQVQVHVADADRILLHAPRPAHRLETWVAARVGPLRSPLQDISGGRWRSLHEGAAQELPVHPMRERRKFLATSDQGRWLVKFAGLGAEGPRKLARAQLLAAAGFSPAPAGLCHGFLVERWRDDLRPLAGAPQGPGRARLIDRIADYLGFRARHFAAPASPGSPLQQLWEMGRANTEEAFGPAAASGWAGWQAQLPALAREVRRIETDNRMHAWEWLSDGETLLKTDALDHHAGHDLVGCQDLAWDVAGAALEWSLAPRELERLVQRLAAHGHALHPRLLSLMRLCYAAFELGRCREAEAALQGADRLRMQAQAARYESALRSALAQGTAP